MKSLVFDTETTGLVEFTKKHNDPVQPHAVQLGMELIDDDKEEVISSVGLIIRAEKKSHPKAEDVHRITSEVMDAVGIPPKMAADLFLTLATKADRLVAHNIDFDQWVMKCECARLNLEYPIGKPTFCTMKDSGRSGTHAGRTKWPKLIEIYKELVDPNGFEGAHDALSDVIACRKVLWALKKLKNNEETKEDMHENPSEDYDEGSEMREYEFEEIIVDKDDLKSWKIKFEDDLIDWIPKKVCTLNKKHGTVSIPNWLARKKGLLEE